MEIRKRKPIIFIVSGKANTGKDTTCDFIRANMLLKNIKSIKLQFSSYIKMYAKELSSWDGSEKTKPRTLLQELGTDVIRKNLGDDFFVKRMVDDINVYSYYLDVITISDTRFPIEIDTIYNNFDNVIRINVERPNFENNLNNLERKHISETALDNYDKYDYKLVNDGTLDDLNNKIKDMLEEVLNNEKVK